MLGRCFQRYHLPGWKRREKNNKKRTHLHSFVDWHEPILSTGWLLVLLQRFYPLFFIWSTSSSYCPSHEEIYHSNIARTNYYKSRCRILWHRYTDTQPDEHDASRTNNKITPSITYIIISFPWAGKSRSNSVPAMFKLVLEQPNCAIWALIFNWNLYGLSLFVRGSDAS